MFITRALTKITIEMQGCRFFVDPRKSADLRSAGTNFEIDVNPRKMEGGIEREKWLANSSAHTFWKYLSLSHHVFRPTNRIAPDKKNGVQHTKIGRLEINIIKWKYM